ncbi:hypothetical protein PRIPAC_95757, partial [Pristionchus pacificus]|uniref:Uncharacterized protein n=1 Tax=Pristionchus pacificus TaxID=54126 RepID=A0A2A6BD80_PRIPA
VERAYRTDRLKHFAFTQPVIYQADTYLTRIDIISKLSLSNILVFSPLMILFIALTFAVSFFVEKITHAIHLWMKLGRTDSFFSDLFGKSGHQLDCESKSSGSLVYRFIFTRILAAAFIHMIYTSVFTGSTVFSVSKEMYEFLKALWIFRDMLDMIGDIKRSQSRLIIEHPSFLNTEKTNSIFGPGYSFPSESVISDKKDFIDYLCKHSFDYGKVNSFFISTVNPQQKIKYPCEIATIAPGKLQNLTSSIQNSVIQPSPYTLLLRKSEKSRLKKSLNAVIITIFQFE